MLPLNQNPPRIEMQFHNPEANLINYQFCFLNQPFVNEADAKDIYYKLLVWPKATKMIENFSFLIKIQHQGLLKPLEIIEFPRLNDNSFDPFGDQHLTIKIPQNLYQKNLQFSFSFGGFNQTNQGQLQIDLEWRDSHQVDDLLIFYDSSKQQSTNLLTWTLEPYLPTLTFNHTYFNLLELMIKITDVTTEITNYNSVMRLRFLALLNNQRPQLNNLTIGNFTTKKPYLFEPKVNWLHRDMGDQQTYQLQLMNQLDIVGDQVQDVSYGERGFKTNPFVVANQGLTLEANYLNHDFKWTLLINQAQLQLLSQWEGPYYEV